MVIPIRAVALGGSGLVSAVGEVVAEDDPVATEGALEQPLVVGALRLQAGEEREQLVDPDALARAAVLGRRDEFLLEPRDDLRMIDAGHRYGRFG